MQQCRVDLRPYSRNEIYADAAVHGVGAVAGTVGGFLLFAHVVRAGGNWSAIGIYVLGLVAMLGCSAIYNLWPETPVKDWLRRFDHSAIFLLIAGTYTPLLPFLVDHNEARVLGLVVWTGAAIGIAIKFFLPGRFDRLAIAVYLGLGWAGIISARSFYQVLPGPTLMLVAIGGLLYTAGVAFHLWQRLTFHNAIWHAFVASAAACHFAAIARAYA